MNSLLGSIGNSLLNSVGGSGAVSSQLGGTSILLQALGAAMRGESPQAFMKKLASQHPQLKRMNLDDLHGTAQQLCSQNGVNANDLAHKIDEVFDPVMSK